MKTRRARIVLTDKTIDVTDINDGADWQQYLALNTWWLTDRRGTSTFTWKENGAPRTLEFTADEVLRIELWPGSEEPS